MPPSRALARAGRGNLTQLRKAVVQRGLSAATWLPEASEGRAVEATVKPARLVEGEHLQTHSVGPAEAWPGVVAFMDGIQRYQIVGYLGSAPLVVAHLAAAVRERRDRRLTTARMERERVALGRPEVLRAVEDLLHGVRAVPLSNEEPGHPVVDLEAARRAIDRERGALELRVGESYRRDAEGWLVVDGSLAESPQWAASPRMIGVAKSHATLPFAGREQVTYLETPFGHRSSVFAPKSHTVAPVYSWSLRLWPWEGKDLFHGLIRVETAPTQDALEGADQIGRWLLAERAPVSTPDPRWDRLLYGIHDVEVYLRTRMV